MAILAGINFAFVVTTCVLCVYANGEDADSDEIQNPLAKVIQMLSGLQQTIIKEGEGAHKEYVSYSEWCEDTSKDLKYEIDVGKSTAADLKAVIDKASATIEELEDKVEDLAEQGATAETELKDATKLRKKEAVDFATEEKELKESRSAIKRAIKVLSEQGGASMLQYGRARDVAKVLGIMVQAAVLNSADGDRLTALVQRGHSAATSGDDDDDDSDGHTESNDNDEGSGGILEVLEGLQDKAEERLATAREAETKATQDFELLKQSLTNEANVAASELEEAKNNIAANKEKMGVAQGDLDVTSKDLAADVRALDDTHKNCMKSAADYEEGQKIRDEELSALATAKKVIQDVADGGSFEQVSLLQVSAREESGSTPVVSLLLEVAAKYNSRSIAQLAHRITSTIRLKRHRGQNPFGKVKALISDMIAKLEKAAGADATHKAYCDKENKESNEKKNDKSTEIEKFNTAIDEASSQVAVLEEQVSLLSKDLAALAKSQAEQDELFAETETTFTHNTEELKHGIEGVMLALKVLKKYYAKGDSASDGGAAGSIIALLETVEADFEKGLSELQSAFSNKKSAYVMTTQENQIVTTEKKQAVKYKNQEITTLKKTLKEVTSDRKGVQTELDALNLYMARIAEQCVEQAEPYEEVKARRDAEIAGLRQGLQVLEGQAALLQTGHSVLRQVGFLRRHK